MTAGYAYKPVGVPATYVTNGANVGAIALEKKPLTYPLPGCWTVAAPYSDSAQLILHVSPCVMMKPFPDVGWL